MRIIKQNTISDKGAVAAEITISWVYPFLHPDSHSFDIFATALKDWVVDIDAVIG